MADVTRYSVMSIAIALVFALVAVLLTGGSCSGISGQKSDTKLIVVIVVDQMRPDYLKRFEPYFTGGFARLLDEGAVFPNAYHEHAMTATAVGHATIATGMLPAHHGIVANGWYDRDERREVYSCQDERSKIVGYPNLEGRSPRRMLTPSVGDLLKKKHRGSKVFSAALKDRAAIFMGGFEADAAYWYNRDDGRMISSEFYLESYPERVDSFNSSGYVEQFREEGWEKGFSDSVYAVSRTDEFHTEYDSVHTAFPHPFDTVSEGVQDRYYYELYYTPFSDKMVLEFSKLGLIEHALGQDGVPDLLLVGCSAADPIGHRYGPFSHEVQDYYLRLDQYLADFFAFVDSTVGKENYLTVLTSDHGVLPLPEHLLAEEKDAGRVSLDDVRREMLEIGQEVSDKLKLPENVIDEAGYDVRFKFEVATAYDFTPGIIMNLVADKLRTLPYIEDIILTTDLAPDEIQQRPYRKLYQNNYCESRGPDLFIRFKPNYLVTNDYAGTTHGSPYQYDTQVPLIFSGKGIKTFMFADSVRSVDIAPTILDLVGDSDSTEFDGWSLASRLVR